MCTGTVDECGVCDGPGLDCNDECDGAIPDECGVCGGPGIQGGCDCAGNVLDSCGVCGGNDSCEEDEEEEEEEETAVPDYILLEESWGCGLDAEHGGFEYSWIDDLDTCQAAVDTFFADSELQGEELWEAKHVIQKPYEKIEQWALSAPRGCTRDITGQYWWADPAGTSNWGMPCTEGAPCICVSNSASGHFDEPAPGPAPTKSPTTWF